VDQSREISIRCREDQELVDVETTTSELSRVVGAPLQEININDAQTRLTSKITKRNMAGKLAEVFSLINHRKASVKNRLNV
jgi:hypothetical protein